MSASVFGKGAMSLALVVLMSASSADAALVATYEVGSGSSVSNLQFDFANGNTHWYVVRWDGVVSGRDLFDIVAAAQPSLFAFETQVFPFGEALFSVAIGDDLDAGFGTPPKFLDFWHYWVKPTFAAEWGFAPTGFADRIVADGSWDGWVFGSNDAPFAVPAAPTLALVAAFALPRRRRYSSLSRSLARTP